MRLNRSFWRSSKPLSRISRAIRGQNYSRSFCTMHGLPYVPFDKANDARTCASSTMSSRSRRRSAVISRQNAALVDFHNFTEAQDREFRFRPVDKFELHRLPPERKKPSSSGYRAPALSTSFPRRSCFSSATCRYVRSLVRAKRIASISNSFVSRCCFVIEVLFRNKELSIF